MGAQVVRSAHERNSVSNFFGEQCAPSSKSLLKGVKCDLKLRIRLKPVYRRWKHAYLLLILILMWWYEILSLLPAESNLKRDKLTRERTYVIISFVIKDTLLTHSFLTAAKHLFPGFFTFSMLFLNFKTWTLLCQIHILFYIKKHVNTTLKNKISITFN